MKPALAVLALCGLAVPLGAQFGAIPEGTLYDQAAGKWSKTNFGPFEEYVQGKDPDYGPMLLRLRHVLDLSRAMKAGGNASSTEFENQVIEYRYPYDPELDEHRKSGDKQKLDKCIESLIRKGFVRVSVVAGNGKGVSLHRTSNGKYMLWPHAPAAFGNTFDRAGVVVKDKDEYLYAGNTGDASILVFISPASAERHYASGRVEVLSATFVESAMFRLPLLGGACAGVAALILIAVVVMRRKRAQSQSGAQGTSPEDD